MTIDVTSLYLKRSCHSDICFGQHIKIFNKTYPRAASKLFISFLIFHISTFLSALLSPEPSPFDAIVVYFLFPGKKISPYGGNGFISPRLSLSDGSRCFFDHLYHSLVFYCNSYSITTKLEKITRITCRVW